MAQSLVVVGNGMTSFRLCQKLVACGAIGELSVVVCGEEPRPAYDRLRLTEMLAGREEDDLTLAPTRWYEENGIALRLGDPVLRIDRDDCSVRCASGDVIRYDRLLLATGSRPFVPPIPGVDLPGVFVYRTVDDLRRIRERARGATSAAVLGGGLLGLEAARAARDLGLDVHVIEHGRGLMSKQLDDDASELLRERVEALGVRVSTRTRVTRIEVGHDGQERLLVFEGGARLAVDLVVIATGIRPRGELGRGAGLRMTDGGAVVIDDHLATSDPRIFAVGECAAHRGMVYGLAAPGYRMVDVMVDNLVGGDAAFTGADHSAKLKLLGVDVAVLGRFDDKTAETHVHAAGGMYRKLLVRDRRIVGAMAVGAWPDLDRVRAALDEPRAFSYWDLRRFRSTGTLFLKSESPPVYEWPAETIVCGCAGVTRGALTEAEIAGCCTVDELSRRTGAARTCGSCRPLLAELLQHARVDSMPLSAPPPSAPVSAPLSAPYSESEPWSASFAEPLSTPGDTPPTLRCSALPDTPAAPPSVRPPVFLMPQLHDDEPASVPSPVLRADLDMVLPPPRVETATLRSIDVLLEDALASAPPPSRSGPPSSRRDSLPPLRPISVPPSVAASHPSGRLPPSRVPGPEIDERRYALWATAAAALSGALALSLAPAVPPAKSILGLRTEAPWSTRAGKQATGFLTLALVGAGLLLSLRKRWKRFSYGDVPAMRVLHGALGAAALVCALCHTGLRLGERLDRLLALDFAAASVLGAVAAVAVGRAGDAATSHARRQMANRAHLFILVPLPVLLALHVLGAYYF